MRLEKLPKTFYVTDGEDRGPLTMARVRFHPTDRVLLGQCVDRRLALWNLDAEPKKVDRKKEPYVVGSLVCPHDLGWVRGFDVAPDGSFVVTGGSDRRLKRWGWSDGVPATEPSHEENVHDGWIEAVAISPDGRLVATAGADRIARIHSSNDLAVVHTLEGHENYVRDVAWTPDGSRLLTAAEDGFVHVWDATNGQRIGSIEFGEANDQQGQNPSLSGAHCLSLSRDGHWIAVAGGRRVEVYDASTFQPVATEAVKHDVRFHPKRDVLAAGESKLELWEYDAGKFVPPKPDDKGRPGKLGGVPGKKGGSVNRGEYSLGIDFSPEGDVMALGKSDGSVELWRLT